jgi:hypothetical protein
MNARSLIIAACLAVVCSMGSAMAATCPAEPPSRLTPTEVGRFYSDNRSIAAGSKDVQVGTAGAPARYARFLLRAGNPAATNWVLSIRNSDDELLESFGHAQFASKPERWTRRLELAGAGTVLKLSLDLLTPGQSPDLEIIKIVSMAKSALRTYYSAADLNKPKWSAIAKASPADRRLAESVGILFGNLSDKTWCCSGVVIGENLLLTNWHCGSYTDVPADKWSSPEICPNTIINLGWLAYPEEQPAGTRISDREFVCEEVLLKDEKLDFAVLKIRSLLGNDTARPIAIRTDPLTPLQSVSLIHHPACLPKQLTEGCQVNRTEHPGWTDTSKKTELLHSCESDRGSSGAALVDGQGKLVGLHHLGYETINNNCDYQNKAVRIGEILEALKRDERVRAIMNLRQ